jgi:DNA polymerase-3 subunit epsilon
MLAVFSNWFRRNPKLPQKWRSVNIKEAPLLAIDLELTSLDTQVAKITSIGWICGKNPSIDLNSAYYNIIRASGDLQQSPVIHGLTARDLVKGEHIKTAVDILTKYASSHIWVLHNASLDMQVLDKVAKALGLPKTHIVTFDTMLLELYFFNKAQRLVKQDAVTLGNCRQRYGLNSDPNHNALDDALATLSLAFAQWYKLDKTGHARLSDLIHTKAVKVYTVGTAEA